MRWTLSRKRSVLHRLLSLLAVLTFLAVLGVGAIAGYRFFGPFRGYQDQVFIEVEHGMSSRDIAKALAEEGVVRSRWAFLAIRMLHPRASLQAGEYQFSADATPWQVFEKIRRGEIFFEELTVPEGSNMFDIAGILNNSDTVDGKAFLHEAADPASIRDLDPLAPNLEGYLFPSTYRVTHKTTAKQLCRSMTSEFRRRWATITGNKQADVHRLVTLASLVEKETAVKAERPLVAAVFSNRLSRSIPLQCDPTTVYAALLENRYRGTIYKSDLASTNPYNTYAHAGLPPGPIANPGAASLRAAFTPAKADFLYFVAKPDGSGSHHFSATLEEHLKAVQAYRSGGH